MDQPQQPPAPSNLGVPPAQQPIQQQQPGAPLPYKTGEGSYNRESGKKTLVFVGVIIALIAVLSVTSLLLINTTSSVKIQSQTDQQPQTLPITPSLTPTNAPVSTEEAELETIQIDDSTPDFQELQQDASAL